MATHREWLQQELDAARARGLTNRTRNLERDLLDMHDETPCPRCGNTGLEGQYLDDEAEDEGVYDGYLCINCRTFWTLQELEEFATNRRTGQ